MNILLCTLEYSHSSQSYTGGIGAFYQEYAKKLSENNNVTVLSLSVDPFNGKDDSVTYESYRPIGYSNLTKRLCNTSNIFLFFISFIVNFIYRFIYSWRVKKTIKKYNIDIIETHDYKGIASLFKLVGIKIPVIIRVHGTNKVLYQNNIQNKNKLAIFHENIVNTLYSSFIFISEASKLHYFKAFSKKNDSIICYNLAPDSREFENKFFDNKKELKVCNFGAMSYSKGIDIFLDIATHCATDNFSFHLYGKETKDYTAEKISHYKNITYHGLASRDELLNNLSTFDIFIFPSRFENCPMSWIEAIRSGGIILVSDIDVSREMVIDNETGFICKTTDEYINILMKLKNNILRENINSNANNFIDTTFSPKTMIEKSLLFYKSKL